MNIGRGRLDILAFGLKCYSGTVPYTDKNIARVGRLGAANETPRSKLTRNNQV